MIIAHDGTEFSYLEPCRIKFLTGTNVSKKSQLYNQKKIVKNEETSFKRGQVLNAPKLSSMFFVNNAEIRYLLTTMVHKRELKGYNAKLPIRVKSGTSIIFTQSSTIKTVGSMSLQGETWATFYEMDKLIFLEDVEFRFKQAATIFILRLTSGSEFSDTIQPFIDQKMLKGQYIRFTETKEIKFSKTITINFEKETSYQGSETLEV
jgi:hypothetical protein